MSKFRVGDTCKVVKNLFAPKCIGHFVEILNVVSKKDGRILYSVKENEYGMQGYASETCLELME